MVGLAYPSTANCSMRPVLARKPEMSSSKPVETRPGTVTGDTDTAACVTMSTGDWHSVN